MAYFGYFVNRCRGVLHHKPQATLLSLAIVLGVFMLVSGILNIVAFAGAHNEIFGSGWLLVEGILNCIIGVFLLFNEWITVAALPFIFGMWVLFSGLCRLIGSFDMKKLGCAPGDGCCSLAFWA